LLTKNCEVGELSPLNIKEFVHRYKVDTVVSTIIETREQIQKMIEVIPTMEEISIDVSDDEKKIILQELELLEAAISSLIK